MKTLALYTLIGVSTLAYAGGTIGDEKEPKIPEIFVEVEEEVASSSKSFYIGLATNLVSARETGATLNYFDAETGQERVGNASLIAGYNFYKYLSVEARASGSIAYEHVAKFTAVSLFVKPQYKVIDKFSVHALLGYGCVKLDSLHGSNVNVDDKGFQWGLGASYDMSDSASLFVEYNAFANEMEGTFLTDDAVTVDAITVGVIYKF